MLDRFSCWSALGISSTEWSPRQPENEKIWILLLLIKTVGPDKPSQKESSLPTVEPPFFQIVFRGLYSSYKEGEEGTVPNITQPIWSSMVKSSHPKKTHCIGDIYLVNDIIAWRNIHMFQ